MLRLHAIVLVMLLGSGCGSSSSDSSGGGGSGSDTSGGGSGASSSGGEGAGGGEEGGGEEHAAGEFQLSSSQDASQAHGEHPSQIQADRTHAAMRLFVVDRDTGPVSGVVIKLTAPDGTVFYTGETDSLGYAEVLVPPGQRYELEYLSLGRRTTSASVNVPAGPNQDIRLTMRHRRVRPLPPLEPAQTDTPEERFILEGINFQSASATIEEDSYPQLDRVVEYMQHRPTVRLRITGHTDNAGNPRRNQQLSEQRARAVRQYIIDHGIDGGRVEAVGMGDRQPIASNDTDEGRAQNRRIEAIELFETPDP
ncbi:MAG: OmpA family protein [Sandaracinaceae bacterium]